MISLRVARKEDADGILAIYSPFVKNTNTSFEYEVSEAADYMKRMEELMVKYPWLVAEVDGVVVGYTYASKHRDRIAYQWSAESSIYIHADYIGQGLASTLYNVLFDILAAQNLVNLYAGIAQPNEESTMFHVKMGFTPVGVYKKVGYKNGNWIDVVWLHRTLIKHPAEPKAPLAFSAPEIQAKTQELLLAATTSLNLKKQA
ncbi:MAG: GNAT family N-acetyltransferase [Bacteroidota bacterium]|jgi:L-amino acid N-acyltransferase YncA